MFEKLAFTAFKWADWKPGHYEGVDVTGIIVGLPFRDGQQNLPVLGDNLPINQMARTSFFDILEHGRLEDMTTPFLVSRSFLERPESHADWLTLAKYLHPQNLKPQIVFRNTPIPMKSGPQYVASLRVTVRLGGMGYEYRP